MTETLADAILALAKKLPTNLVEGTATGGSATTLVDTGFPYLDKSGNAPADDYYNAGTIFILGGDNEGVTEMITDFAQTTYTFTFASQSSGCSASDRYAVIPRDYPRYVLVQAVNEALMDIGEVPQIYTASAFVTVADQEEYDLPSGVRNVRRLQVANSKSTPYDWEEHKQWEEDKHNGRLVFFTGCQPASAGYLMRLEYEAVPSSISANSATISDYVAPDKLAAMALPHALEWKMDRSEMDNPFLISKYELALKKALQARVSFFENRSHVDVKLDWWAGL